MSTPKDAARTYALAAADDPLRNEQDHFLACVRDRSRARALDLPQALAGLKLADAAIESLRLLDATVNAS